MQPTQTFKEESAPLIQLLKLGLFVTIGLVIIVFLSYVLIFLANGNEIFRNPKLLANVQFSIPVLKIILVAQQILVFLLPAIALSIFEGRRPTTFYDIRKPKLNLLFIVLMLMLCSIPILGLTAELNQKMVFPSFLKWLEEWMINLEKQGEETTEAILKMNNIGALLINLFVIAIIPAICEEFIFRGALQRIFIKMVRNPHVAIWISAAVFSTIHFQFFGFFPRLFLGAAFGYIYFWTKSIWYTVFAHFLNNGYAVVIAYYFQKQNLPLKQADETSIAWYGYLISAILTLALFKLLKDQSLNNNADSNNQI